METVFKDLIRTKIEPTIHRFGFKLISEGRCVMEYSSNALVLRLAYDARERSSNFFVGTSNRNLVLFDDEILSNVFGGVEKIDRVSLEEFVTNLNGFLENEGSTLMSGCGLEFERLLSFQEKRSEAYTALVQGK